MSRVVANFNENLLKFTSGSSDRLEYSVQFIGRDVSVPPVDQQLTHKAITASLKAQREASSDRASLTPEDAQAEAIGNVRSTIGYLFLDRTRISPAGFALGEHVFSLSLAPGEEVILEQKTWTTRQLSLEELVEQERQLDLEQSSTLSTELQAGLTQESELRRSFGVATSFESRVGATVPIESVPVELNASGGLKTEANLQQADSTTRTESIKRSFQRTTKVAAKYRSLHKTTFKISSEIGFQATSKRTIRNPNQGSAVTLHFFKLMHALSLTRERYGVQLCWAPFIKDPGFAVRQRIRKAREDAAAGVSAEVILPPKPLPPASTADAEWIASLLIDLDDYFGLLSDMRVDVEAAIDIPDGKKWDGVNARVELHFDQSRGHSSWIKGQPWQEGTKLKATIHTGIDWTLTEARGHAAVQFFATFVPAEALDPKALQEYHEALARWEQEVARLQADARRRAGEQALSDVDRILAELYPIAELIPAVVRSFFDPTVRDDHWEIERWHRVFDFDSGGYALYPGTWDDKGLPFPERGPADFVNASWARVFLPIRPEYELAALRFIYGGALDKPLDPSRETQFQQLLNELAQYRTAHFGASTGEPDVDPQSKALQERFVALARWKDTLPTDGTHMEAVLSSTTSFDPLTEQAMQDEKALRDALVADRRGDGLLKTKALEMFGKAGTTTIQVSTDGQ